MHQLLLVVCIVFHNVMLFLGAVFAGTLSMWHIASPHVLCQHSCWSSIPIPLSGARFFYLPIWLVCRMKMIQLIIIHLPLIATPSVLVRYCLNGQYLPKLGYKSSLSCGHSLIMFVWSICKSASLLMQFWCLLLMCRLALVLLCWVCVCWCLFQLFPGLYSWCNSDGIANPLCIGLVQTCITCTPCTSEYAALCIAATVIG